MRQLVNHAVRSLAATEVQSADSSAGTSTGVIAAVAAVLICAVAVAALGALCSKSSTAVDEQGQQPPPNRNINTSKWGGTSGASREAKTNTTSTNVMLEPTTTTSNSKEQNLTESPDHQHDNTGSLQMDILQQCIMSAPDCIQDRHVLLATLLKPFARARSLVGNQHARRCSIAAASSVPRLRSQRTARKCAVQWKQTPIRRRSRP